MRWVPWGPAEAQHPAPPHGMVCRPQLPAVAAVTMASVPQVLVLTQVPAAPVASLVARPEVPAVRAASTACVHEACRLAKDSGTARDPSSLPAACQVLFPAAARVVSHGCCNKSRAAGCFASIAFHLYCPATVMSQVVHTGLQQFVQLVMFALARAAAQCAR
jgi:hypothetical protein